MKFKTNLEINLAISAIVILSIIIFNSCNSSKNNDAETIGDTEVQEAMEKGVTDFPMPTQAEIEPKLDEPFIEQYLEQEWVKEYEPLVDSDYLEFEETLEKSSKEELVARISEFVGSDLKRFKEIYDDTEKNFKANAKLKASDFKAFNRFMLDLIGLMNNSSYYYTKELKESYLEKNDTIKLVELKRQYDRFENHHNTFISYVTSRIEISYYQRRTLNGKEFEIQFQKVITSFVDLISKYEDDLIAYNSSTRKVLKASLFQEQEPTKKEVLEEKKLALDIQKVSLDIASGAFGLINTIIKAFNKKWENKVKVLSQRYSFLKVDSWEKI